MAGSGFFKGEKKKQKKGKNVAKVSSSNAPVFVLPEIISRKKDSKF